MPQASSHALFENHLTFYQKKERLFDVPQGIAALSMPQKNSPFRTEEGA